jgi:hypothetical protein
MNAETVTETAQFFFWEYINSNIFAVWKQELAVPKALPDAQVQLSIVAANLSICSLHNVMKTTFDEPLQNYVHCKEIWIYVFPEKELGGISPNFHIHVSVSDFCILTFGPPIFLQQNRQTDQRNI